MWKPMRLRTAWQFWTHWKAQRLPVSSKWPPTSSANVGTSTTPAFLRDLGSGGYTQSEFMWNLLWAKWRFDLGTPGEDGCPKWEFWASKSFCSWLKTCLNADKSNQWIHIPQPPWIMVFQLKLSASRSPPEPFMRQPAAELGGMWLTLWQKWICAKQSVPTQQELLSDSLSEGTKLWLWLTVGSRCRWLNGGGCNEGWLYLIDN